MLDVGIRDRGGAAREPEEVLDVAGGTGQRARGDPPCTEAEVPRGRGDSTYGVDAAGRVTDDTAGTHRLASHLELRLDHQQQIPVFPGAAGQCRQDQCKRNERKVGDGEIDLSPDLLRAELADIGSLMDLDAVVAAQPPCQLTVTDVHCVNLFRATL